MKHKFYSMPLAVLLLLFIIEMTAQAQTNVPAYRSDGYRQMKADLMKGWGTYHTRDVLTHVLLPEGAGLSIDLYRESRNSSDYLEEVQFNYDRDKVPAYAIPLAHAWDGSYTCLEVVWGSIIVRVETAIDGQDFMALLTPVSITDSTFAVVEAGVFWNRDGQVAGKGHNLEIVTPHKTITVWPAGALTRKYNVAADGPYLCLSLSEETGFSTGRKRSVAEITRQVTLRKDQYRQQAARYGNWAPAWEAISTSVNWNTIYDPVKDRIFTTVSRTWNVSRGGYTFFGWDNFFMGYLAALESKELAFANIIEHLQDKTPAGFIPNNSQGNGRQTWDRSQPPVGSMMVWEIYRKYPEKWFLEAVFDELLAWNQWWMDKRLYKGMLCWGSNPEKNPYNDPNYHNLPGAVMESGLDDSPMYFDGGFNREASVMELHDVGLNGMYAADCQTLAKIAGEINRNKEEKMLRERAELFRTKLNSLWNEKAGIYQNRSTATGDFSERISPTVFYPLLTGTVSRSKADRMIREYFYNTDKFWGDYILPSVPHDDPSFPEQKYWRGAVWAPLNFLVYLGLRNNELPTAAKDLSKKSGELFVKEWERMHYVSENYSAITGTGDDERLRSDRFYTWGALLGIIPLAEEGFMQNK